MVETGLNVCQMCNCVLQESQWLDSVSLLIKDSLEGDMIDNLSGSVFHHYCSPPVCKDCKSHPQEVSGAAETHTNTHGLCTDKVGFFFFVSERQESIKKNWFTDPEGGSFWWIPRSVVGVELELNLFCHI